MTEPYLGAWQIDAERFPHAGGDEERLRFAARYGRLAPSGHNSQPWFFEIVGDVLTVKTDPARALPTIDADGRELTLTCAGAAQLAALALARFGYPPVIDLSFDPSQPDVVARLRVGAPTQTPSDHVLFDSITRRHSNRHGYQRRAVPAKVLAQLEAAALDHGCWLVPLTDPQVIATAARLIGAGDRVKWREREFRHELAERLIPNSGLRRDGMPGYAFGVPGPLSRWAPEVIRRVNLGHARSVSDGRLARATPVLLVLGTDDDDRASWVAAGFAMADVLLRAASAGLATGFLSQAIEVPELRPRIGELAQRPGFAQLLLRCGYPTRRPRPSPRRAMEDIVIGPKRLKETSR